MLINHAMKNFFVIILMFHFLNSNGQLKPIGSWTDHLPYSEGTSISTNGTDVFCGTSTGLFSYNVFDNSISRFSKINRLNGVNIAKLKYNPYNSTLIIVYQDANIDLLKNGTTINIPFIKNDNAINSKEINEIKFFQDKIYLSFGFGIVEINSTKNEIADSYLFGNNGTEIAVNSSAIFNDTIYAATNTGIYSASLNSNLLDYNSWKITSQKQDKKFKKLITFNSNLIAVQEATNNQDSVFSIINHSFNSIPNFTTETFKAYYIGNNELIYVSNNSVRFLDPNLQETKNFNRDNSNTLGIVKANDSKLYFVNGFQPLVKHNDASLISTIKPNGPADKTVTSLAVKDGVLWSTNGGFDGAYNSLFRFAALSKYENGSWTSFYQYDTPNLTGAFDIMSVTFNPDIEGEAYFGSFGTALYKVNAAGQFEKIDDQNSSLQERQDVVWDWIGAPDAAFDKNGHLWVTNAYTNNCLSARVNGTWQRYNMLPQINAANAVTELLITDDNHKWVAVPRSNAILVFDDNNTPSNTNDDRKILLSSEAGQGSIPGIAGLTMTLDQKGQVWVGTSDGIAVFYNPGQVFEAGKRDAQRILIEGDENVEVLLAGTIIRDIAIDGANRKWIATEASGVYLVSEDGTETIHHFTEENSPLFSNNVSSIGIDQKTGEVYFGTGNGIISYRGTATEGSQDFNDVKVFPNPVKENYLGPISISGLINNTKVKITDIQGNLVNELRSNGGQAIWYGDTFNGERVKTGVYLIFNSGVNEKEALKTHIAKILVIN